jgi:two-component system, LytTR family, response regulator
MKILIIEDEPLVARDLQNLLKKIEPDSKLLGVLTSVDAARKWFSGNPPPDLILSDIQLSDGISFDIYENLQLSCPIIFTTAYDDYAIRAFKLNSVDYLLKPIDSKELSAAISKYKSLTTENVLSDQLKALMAGWNQQPQKKYKERFLTLHRNTLVPVTQQDIAYFCKEELIYLHTMANERFISEHHTLDEIESLINPEIFYRVNRQFIVHVQAVGKIKTTHKGLSVQLKAPFHNEIDLSREKAASFKSWIG